jgi:serine/threonine protein kinase
MAEQPPVNPSPPDPSPGEITPPALDLEAILGDGVESSDDAPTIISKVPPTQTFMPAPAYDLAANKNLRGRTLAHFELLDPIGVGGMAAVIRARDKQLDRIVALKILPPELATDPEHVQRFHQEARAAAKLDHENIARVYFCGEDQKLHFIAFEFVDGQNLRTLLERRGQLQVSEAVHYLLQIASGLAHAASRGVVHRDIKPSNIIITPSGRAKLVDMGLARSLAPHDNQQLTQSGVTLGTFDYISPEQALEPRDADVRSDIYSLGCTFYHMLTGQPPVPDGTAAKKLHHHHNVAPIDPRQINPEIPDEVAAILQHMMAKDPKDRYQRAEHLVQHLLQAAQKLGGVDVPEGLLFVDAPLPTPPRKRPVLLGAIAALALTLFVLIVSLASPRMQGLPPLRPKSNIVAVKDDTPRAPSAGSAKETPVASDKIVTTEKELAEALADERTARIVVANDLQLSEAALTYRGSGKRSVVIETQNTDKPATIKLIHPRDEEPMPFGAGITVDSGTLVFKNLQFSIDALDTPRTLVAGIVVKGGHVTFDSCSFRQQTPTEDWMARPDLVPIASVAAWDPGLDNVDRRPPLTFRKCYFAGGQAAVSIRGKARVEQSNCALGPHATMFHIWGQDKERNDEAELLLANVSAHVIDGPVFRVDDDVSCRLDVQYSLFSCPENAALHDHADLIRQTSATIRGLRYDGKHNVYHNLTAFWVRPGTKDQMDEATWEVFKARVAQNGGGDATSIVLREDPWRNVDGNERSAFRIKDTIAELRRPDQKSRPIGVEVCAWGPVYSGPLASLEPRPQPAVVQLPPSGERWVDPTGKQDHKRIHKKLEAALSEAEFGDVILIKHTGPLPIEPCKLTDKRGIKIKPWGDFQPILVLGKSADKDAALFHLHKSQLEFEQLEVVLHAEENRRSLSVVNLGDQSSCQFKQCVLTLDGAINPGADLDVVTILDPREMMMTTPDPSQKPEVHIISCLVRGKGDLVSVRASRAFDLDVDKSLVCLSGSLLTCKASTGDAMPLDARASIRLSRSTTYLTEPLLVEFSTSKSGRGLAAIAVDSSGCLFVSAAGKPLVRLDGPEGEMPMKKLLAWTGSMNAYAGFDKIFDAPGGDGAMATALYADDWKRFTESGNDTRFLGTLFVPEAGSERIFSKVLPQDFRLKSEVSVYGAVIDQLPRPSLELNEE